MTSFKVELMNSRRESGEGAIIEDEEAILKVEEEVIGTNLEDADLVPKEQVDN